jgi:CRP-like cAMP-binding protein
VYSQLKASLKGIAPLTDEDCDLFTQNLRLKNLDKGTHFLQIGEVARYIGFVNSGSLRMYYLADGKEVNIRFFLPNGYAACYQSLSFGEPSRYGIEALEEAELVIFDNSTLEKAYAQSHRWERFGRRVAELLFMQAERKIESLLFMTAEERYVQLLAEYPMIFSHVPLYHIASYLGVERETLSRLRNKIKREGS